MEAAGRADGGAPFLLCLAQNLEDIKDSTGCGEALLKTLAHQDVEKVLDEKQRVELSMKAMALLREHRDKMRECLPLLKKLAPKYKILDMGLHIAEAEGPKSGGSKPARTPP